MASPAWLAHEAKPPVSQSFVSSEPSGELSAGPSTPNGTATPPSLGTSIPMASNGVTSDSVQESPRAKFANSPGFVVPAPSFSYSVLPNASTCGNLQQSPNSDIKAYSDVAAPPLVSGASSSATHSFSYNISQSGFPLLHNRHSQPCSNKSDAIAQEAGNLLTPSSIPCSVPVPSSTSTKQPSSEPKFAPSITWMPISPSFPMPHGMPISPGTPGPPGFAAPAPISSSPITSSSSVDSSAPLTLRPNVPSAASSLNPAVQPQMRTPYPSMPHMTPPPHGLWLHPPQMGSIPSSPFLPYPAAFPGPYAFPACGVPLPAVAVPDSQPPGVTPVGNAAATNASYAASGHDLSRSTGLHTEGLPSYIDEKHVNKVSAQIATAVDDQLDAWTAHKTEEGIVYYYNALTGESTYDKPPGYKGELEKVSVQPTPVSMVNLPGTDWVLVTTSDGKKYYYNNQTKTSSWQIPSEVAELKKKQQENNVAKEHLVSVQGSNAAVDRASGGMSLSTPAISTGGRDSTSFRPSVHGSSSALDLIKRKLQDSGTPVTSSLPTPSGGTASELNGPRVTEPADKAPHSENSKDKLKDTNGDGNMSETSSDSEEEDSGPSKEECIILFKEMLKERGVAPFSKWEKELPKIVFDPRFKAIPSYSARRSLFEHYVKTRADEERKEKRAAQKAAIEGFKQLLDEASEDINHNTDYQAFKKKWGYDPRFEALEHKDREHLLNERVIPLKKAAEEQAQAVRAAAASSFKSMLRERGDININSRWTRVKDSLRNDARYKSVRHEDREVLFNEYLSEMKAAANAVEQEAKAKREEQDKLKEREREMRKRKEREEQEMERVRLKVRRKEAIASFQALLVETVKEPQASWTESKPKLEKDPQGRATNPDLDPSDTEKLFRDHVKMLYERCAQDYRALLVEVLTSEAAAEETDDGKTILNSWSTAKRLLKPDPRYNRMPRKEREALWRRYAEDMLRRQKSALDTKEERHTHAKNRSAMDSGKAAIGSKRSYDRR